MWIKIKKLILDVLFPKFCFGCKKEGNYLCQDCQTLLEISGFHRNYPTHNLDDLYFAADHKNPLIKRLIRYFRYEPFIKELGKPLSFLIVAHLQLADNEPDFSSFILIPVPLYKKRLKWRGFNQAKELGKELANFLKIPLMSDNLIKIKETLCQADLSSVEERKENVKDVFLYLNPEKIKGKGILLVDDIYATGSTIEECARVLRKAGAKKIIGIVVARE